jgi:GNAT superfamily N-acetyltransferase
MIEILPVRPEEAGELSRIALAAKRHWGYPERWIEIWTPQLTFTPNYFETNEGWVAEVDGKPVAFYTLMENNAIVWVENLWVLPEFMGKGVGRKLFQHAVSIARQHGCKVLRLEADPNAAGFYEKMGMRKVGEQHSEVDGQPRVLPVMEMEL